MLGRVMSCNLCQRFAFFTNQFTSIILAFPFTQPDYNMNHFFLIWIFNFIFQASNCQMAAVYVLICLFSILCFIRCGVFYERIFSMNMRPFYVAYAQEPCENFFDRTVWLSFSWNLFLASALTNDKIVHSSLGYFIHKPLFVCMPTLSLFS